MWYVMQVRTGTEENIRLQCEADIPSTMMERCFIPYYEERKKIGGEWTTRKRILFPGYVFIVTDQMEELFLQLKNVVGMTKLLGTGDEIIPLTDAEVALLNRFWGKDQVVTMSEGIIEHSQVRILSGPLMGLEGMIRKVDRHRRKAWLEIEMFGRIQRVELGLEIPMKTV